MLEAIAAPKNPAPEMSRLSTYTSLCSKNAPATVSASQDPTPPANADIATRDTDCFTVSVVPYHPTRDATALHAATNASRETLIHNSELSAVEKSIAITRAPKNAPIAAQTSPASVRTVNCRTASLKRGMSR